MKNSVKVTFWLNESKKNKENDSPIYMRVWINNEHFHKSTGVNILKRDWDSKAMKVRGNSEVVSAYNEHLEGIRIKIIQIITQLNISGEAYDAKTVKQVFEGNRIKKMTLLEVYDEHLYAMQKMLGKQYTKSTLIKYKNTRLRLSQFMSGKTNTNLTPFRQSKRTIFCIST